MLNRSAMGRAAVVGLLAWAVAASVASSVASSRRREAVERLARTEAELKDREAELAKASANLKAAHAIELRELGRLYDVYPDLKLYGAGENLVNQRYVKSFRVEGDRVKVVMENGSEKAVSPDFELCLLNRDGFVTATATIVWNFTAIEPGEKRADETFYRPSFGEPRYYTVRFR